MKGGERHIGHVNKSNICKVCDIILSFSSERIRQWLKYSVLFKVLQFRKDLDNEKRILILSCLPGLLKLFLWKKKKREKEGGGGGGERRTGRDKKTNFCSDLSDNSSSNQMVLFQNSLWQSCLLSMCGQTSHSGCEENNSVSRQTLWQQWKLLSETK